jgi:hypothetical protein
MNDDASWRERSMIGLAVRGSRELRTYVLGVTSPGCARELGQLLWHLNRPGLAARMSSHIMVTYTVPWLPSIELINNTNMNNVGGSGGGVCTWVVFHSPAPAYNEDTQSSSKNSHTFAGKWVPHTHGSIITGGIPGSIILGGLTQNTLSQ